MIGRFAQREHLAGLLRDLPTLGSRLVLMGGDAGAGKTTVVNAFLSTVGADSSAEVLIGQCVPLGGEGLPYAPVVATLRQLIEQYGREQVLEWAGAGAPALGALLPDLVPSPPETDSLRLQIFEAIARLLERLTERCPLVLVIEDLHWADESTRHLLRFLARAVTASPLLIIATFRTDELIRKHPLRPFLAEIVRLPHVDRLDIDNLSREETGDLLAHLQGGPVSAAELDEVFRRTEGVPYFVAELAEHRAACAGGLPDSLRDALAVRVERLSESTQDLLRVASVAGNRIDHALLEAVHSGGASQDAALREAIDNAVLTADHNGYCFRHALLRDVVHDELLPGQHARLHAQFATVLEQHPELLDQDTAAVEIAHHWSSAHDNDNAFLWSYRAARAVRPAYAEALKMYERVLELWDQVSEPEQVAGPYEQVLTAAAKVAADAGEPDRAYALIKAAQVHAAADAPLADRVDRLVIQGKLQASLMRPDSVSQLLCAQSLLDETAEPVLQAKVLHQLAILHMLAGERVEAIEAATKLIMLASNHDLHDHLGEAHNTLGSTLVGAGQEAEGLEHLVVAGQLAQTQSRSWLRYAINYSDALHQAGQSRAAADTALAGIDEARKIGLHRSSGAMLAGNAAEPLLDLGDWAQADKLIQRALELDPPAHHFVHLQLLQAWLALWRGDLARAEQLVAPHRPLMERMSSTHQYSIMVARIDGELALAQDDHERAWQHTRIAIEHEEILHSAFIHSTLRVGAVAARVLDARDGGSRGDTVRAAMERSAPVTVSTFWRPVIEAELSDNSYGWSAALQVINSLPVPQYLLPYVGYRLGRSLLDHDHLDRNQVRAVLDTAASQAAALGAGLLQQWIGELAARVGGSGRRDPLALLTPREQEVLALIADGRSNAEIGTELFISAKTASVHVSNILAKLGVTSRGAAAAWAHRQAD